jgi:hypothetical protein
MRDDAPKNLQGTADEIIEPTFPGEAEKVEISIRAGKGPNQKIRIANTLASARGETVALKRGAAVRVVIRPKPKATI